MDLPITYTLIPLLIGNIIEVGVIIYKMILGMKLEKIEKYSVVKIFSTFWHKILLLLYVNSEYDI